MAIVNNTFDFETNLSGSCLDKLQEGVWKLGIFSDNPGIEDETSDIFYKDETTKDGTEPFLKTKLGARCTIRA